MEEKINQEALENSRKLNEGNPNTNSTPVGDRVNTGLVGGTNQSNYQDEQEGNVPDRRNKPENNEEKENRH